MTPKERVLTTFSFQEPDRVPINYSANPGIDQRLKAHLGLKLSDNEGLRLALSVDFRKASALYTGPKLHQDDPKRHVYADEWGIRRKMIKHSSGVYWEYVDFPLQDASIEQVENWTFPSPDDYDYSSIQKFCEDFRPYAIYTGGPGLCDVINKNGMLRGTEQALVDLITEDPAGLLLAKRRTDIQLEVTYRTLEASRGGIDFLWIGEDLGMQSGPIISLDLYRKVIRPFHQKFVNLAKDFNIPVMIHSCGSSSWAFDDFIDIGIKAVDALQPEAKDMAPEYLKNTFGNRLVFHGSVSTAGSVAFGSVDDMVLDCRKVLDVMKPGGGYCFAPAHQLQDNSKTENVVAMYKIALDDGVY